MGFWDEPQGAAIFKHATLKGYASLYANKTGKYSSGHGVALIDGYAGRGWYDDETPASPALLLQTAEDLVQRDVRCWFVEADPPTYRALRARVDKSPGAASATVLEGDIADHLPSIIEQIGKLPLLAFVDPFGIGLPFEQLVGLLGRDKGGPGRAATEVLLTFVHVGVHRQGPKLRLLDDPAASDSQRRNAKSTIRRLDKNLGGDWWHELVDEPDFVARVRRDYLQRVLAAAGAGWKCIVVPVADARGGRAIYEMVLFTRHPQGLWFFNDAVSLARRVFEDHVDPDRPLTLFEPEAEWVAIIKRNLKRLLSKGQPVRVIDHIDVVYGDTLGYARGKHLKEAAKQLAGDGFNAGNVKVEPHRLVVVPDAASNTA